MEDFLRACHDAVKDGEAKKLAAAMGLPHVSLLQRANPDNDAHKLTINHLYQILLHTGDMRPLGALADAFGFDLVQRGEPAVIALQDARELLSKEQAELTLAMHSAMEDGHISRTERATVAKEAEDVRASAAAVIAAVKSA